MYDELLQVGDCLVSLFVEHLEAIPILHTLIFTKPRISMKSSNFFLMIVFATLVMACGGSDTYRGSWKATDVDGKELDLVFREHTFVVKHENDSSVFEYSQHSILIENSIETYGIKLDDGRNYQIHFPIANDESKGFIRDGNENVIYTISRDGYLNYEDLYKLH